ncbi:Na(+)/H(+) exchange regulatory cofactor NHE-RF2-like [Xyrauchen texanus]|uniref:Na(+)/H(+) exchange regulatory cofactor NHE-RF2-like n=1 Tax=Xyrauchen texanus TaxID=154827 RepID=UPI002242AD48|nr:Na(+)/H(+) exchange regulatory cofactor NHE-RF2-like [Xyrauchen texanus]XP_051988057.1 Na(+)/H(+) exchange regulatory cofactor NHE-RF2-like [Xyrauchen texanus]XP_051988058.1 Na(+)/H(+) exchange regulatory cofactor NHE-RF2-like [Xyrauchen texanus]
MASDLKPRLCVMKKGENGYGFHLHGEKGKSGQCIRKVERASPAEASGLRAGDRVVEVNGENVERETHHQVVQRIKAVEHETRLLVVDRETDEYFHSLRLTCTEEMAIRVTHSPSSIKQGNGSVSKRTEISKPIRKPRALRKEVPPPSEASMRDPSELLPRLCHLVRSEAGYGFNLHSEKSRPGQYIWTLDPGSPADHAGLKPQDRLIEVNGVNIESMRHAEVVAFIKKGGNETCLLVVDQDTDERFRKMGITPTRIHVKDFDESTLNGSSSPYVNGTSSRSTYSDDSSQDINTQTSRDSSCHLLDPFEETGLCLSPTAAEAKEKVHAKRDKKRAPQMDWIKKHEIFSNF